MINYYLYNIFSLKLCLDCAAQTLALTHTHTFPPTPYSHNRSTPFIAVVWQRGAEEGIRRSEEAQLVVSNVVLIIIILLLLLRRIWALTGPVPIQYSSQLRTNPLCMLCTYICKCGPALDWGSVNANGYSLVPLLAPATPVNTARRRQKLWRNTGCAPLLFSRENFKFTFFFFLFHD